MQKVFVVDIELINRKINQIKKTTLCVNLIACNKD